MDATPHTEIRILIVDDTPEIVRSTEHLLKQAGYTTATAANGVEALELVQTFQPDLLLSDRDMPEMDGLELCRRIKTDPALANIFIILASATFTRTEEQSAGLNMGADSYIARPIANRELLARVDAFVRIVRLNRALREKSTELEAAIVEIKGSAASMVASETRYRRLFETAKDGILTLNAETGRIVNANPSLAQLLSFSRESFIGKHLWELGLFKDIVPNQDNFEEFQGKDYNRYEDLAMETGDGRRIAVEFVSNAYLVDGSRMIQCNIREITERKKVESLLLQTQERLRLIAHSTGDLAWDWDLSTNRLWWNDRMQTGLGYRLEEIEPGIESWKNRIHPDERETVFSHMHEVIDSGGNDWSAEYRFRHADGSYSYFLDRGYVLHRDAGGHPIRMLGTMVDITARKQAERELRQQQELLQSIIDHIPCAVFWKDRESVNLGGNQLAARDLGFATAAEMIGKSNFDLMITRAEAESYTQFDRQVMERGTPILNMEEGFTTPDGVRLEVLTSKVPLRGVDGKVFGVLAIYLDITERKRAEGELRIAKEAAESANQAKSAFLANMSHEIRTPMNGIMGMTGLLLDSEMTPEQRDQAETVRRSCEALLNIINDILDFSKIEAGKLNLETIDFDLRSTVEEALDLFAESAQRKGIELCYLLHAEVPTALRGDPGRLRQIVVNLTGNALKFTQRGEVMIHVTRGEETADRAAIEFAITDTGIGMTPQAQTLLFKPFSQADTSTTRQFGGTGLGLVISKQLVEQMDGHIEVESVLGHGSTFRFTVWLWKQPAEAPETVPLPRRSLPGRRVCIVDDNATNRRILEAYATQWGLHSASAADGFQALALMRDAATRGEPFDLAILDFQMPHMDGLELGQAITADPLLAATRLVLLTSIGLRGQAEKAKQAGIAAYLTKPVHRAQLYECLAMIVDLPASAVVEARDGNPASRARIGLVTCHSLKEATTASQARILVAEDNIVNQKIAVAQLKKLGYRADVVANGLEAVEAVSRVPYALVLMYCQMPEMDGLAATALIRTSEREQGGRRLPIIALTANAMQGDREKYLAADMDDYLSKPVKQGDLGAMVAKWIGDHLTTDEEKESASCTTQAPTADCVGARALEDLRHVDDSGSVLSTLIAHFLADMSSRLATLQGALQLGNGETVAGVAHELIGSSGDLGAQRMRQLCVTLEAAGRAKDLTRAGSLFTQLASEFERVRSRLMTTQATIAQDALVQEVDLAMPTDAFNRSGFDILSKKDSGRDAEGSQDHAQVRV